jgi:acetylornithine/succinyldiaminopimelate/putrescine aminotransferase/predicted amino acid dehydrogenase
VNPPAQSTGSSRSGGDRGGSRHFKPRLNELLRTLKLDVSYERGAGDCLYYRDDAGREITVLDVVGGYGSLLLGHSHPAVVAEAQRLLVSGRPIHAQGSARHYATQLASELSRRAGGDYCVVFGNSGAEGVEAAMKHAMLETRARTFIALEGAFHGKTLGALQLTANAAYREPFELPGLSVVRVRANDVDQLEAAFAACADLAGFIFEPIQGEGGVRPVTAEFARRAAELCAQRDVPLIADECQTGLGRTGTFLACATLGVQPDYIVLSKALGGGIAKISAVLIRRERYLDEFDLQHTSTFAEDDFSCALALKALELIDDALLENVRAKGGRLLETLRSVAAKYPDVIAEVRGVGLMTAVEFCRPAGSTSFLLRFLSAQEDLGYVLSSYLLHAHRIRIAPTLSEKFTLRIEPSALIDQARIDQLVGAVEDVCERIARSDALGLVRHFVGGGLRHESEQRFVRTDAKFIAYDDKTFRVRQRDIPAARVAWLCHMVDADDLVSLEPTFADVSLAEREDFLSGFVPRLAPVVMGAADVRSATGALVRLYPILLPVTSAWMKRQIDRRQLSLAQTLVQQGIDVARSLDCQLVSLGQYTSIATLAGTRLCSREMGITTGNSYAIALAIEAVERALREAGRAAAESVLVVAGAAGNIGRTCAEILAPRFRRTILVGSNKPGSATRLRVLAERIPRAVTTTDLWATTEGNVVVAALNAVDAPLTAQHLGRDALFCDLSVPGAWQLGASGMRPDVIAIRGGIAALPRGEDLGIVDFPLPAGQTYGCMAEAMLLGFEGVRDTSFTGSLTAEHVARVAAMAARHGFALADYRRACVLGSERRESTYALGL